ncbi:MAG: DUF1194 domain-containing protein [Pseudomonadota bacterium]
MKFQRPARVLILIALIALAGFSFGYNKPSAQQRYCDLALVLAIDSSSSVDDREYALQMRGIASALVSEEVLEAILSLGGMYISAFEWNGKSSQKLIFDWTFLGSPGDVRALAGRLTVHERNSTTLPTAVGAALGYGYRLIANIPQPCARQVIDVSGDGPNNDGIKPLDIYTLYNFSNIIVNGLVIKDLYDNPESFYRDPEGYYRKNVIRGGGAFLVLAEGFDDFARAMKQKLLKEIIPGPIGQLLDSPNLVRSAGPDFHTVQSISQ